MRRVISCGIGLGLLAAGAAQAGVELSEDRFTRGNTIEIVRPHAGFDLQAIVDGITDASENNPYIIRLGAGRFVLPGQLVMKEHVSIAGSGMYATRLEISAGAMTAGAAAAAIQMPPNTSLSDLTLDYDAEGAADYLVGIYLASCGFCDEPARIARVYAYHFSALDVGAGNDAIYDDEGDARILDSRVYISQTAGTGLTNCGIRFYRTDAVVEGAEIEVRTTFQGINLGVCADELALSRPTVENSRVEAAGGAEAYAAYNGSASVDDWLVIRGSTLDGDDDAVYGDAAISHSSLIGGVNAMGTQKCVASDNGGTDDLVALDSSCNEPP